MLKELSKIKGLILLTSISLFVSEAHALTRQSETILARSKDAIEDPYFQIAKVRLTELSEEEALEFELEQKEFEAKNTGIPSFPNISNTPPVGGNSNPPASSNRQPQGALDGVIMVVDKLIAIGQKIIPTIEKGKAVVTNNPMSAVSVLPRVEGQDGVVHEMGSWSVPKTQHFKLVYENGLGIDVVSFVYSVSFQHSGKYKGKGDYLTGIRASARSINIMWGFDIDASSQLVQISNIGTEENVVAAATIEMAYTVKNWTRNITNYKSYFVTGKGRIIPLD